MRDAFRKIDKSDKTIDVLIVGAGLSGLMMAAQLLRYGIAPTVIDQKLGPDKQKVPVSLHARTMELMHQLGLDQAIMERGARKRRLDILNGMAAVEAPDCARFDTFFPERWTLPASELEQLLMAHLTSKACKIHWATRLSALVETTAAVSVDVSIGEVGYGFSGTEQHWESSWVIAADGHASVIRTALGLATDGSRLSVASRFSSRRCFLIADAARPALLETARGLNAGFLDTWNLGWKLAGILSGRIGAPVRFSYHEERSPSGKGNREGSAGRWLETLHRLYRRASGLMGNRLPDVVARWIEADPSRSARVFRSLSGLSVSYRGSSLSVHYSGSERIRAGDRFPWHVLFDEKTKSQTDTRQIFLKPGFVLVIIGNAGSHMIHVLRQWIQQKYPQGLGLYYIPYSDSNKAIFDHFEMPAHAVQAVLVRPDTYIGYMTASVNTFLIDSYMEQVVGWKLHRQFD